MQGTKLNLMMLKHKELLTVQKKIANEFAKKDGQKVIQSKAGGQNILHFKDNKIKKQFYKDVDKQMSYRIGTEPDNLTSPALALKYGHITKKAGMKGDDLTSDARVNEFTSNPMAQAKLELITSNPEKYNNITVEQFVKNRGRLVEVGPIKGTDADRQAAGLTKQPGPKAVMEEKIEKLQEVYDEMELQVARGHAQDIRTIQSPIGFRDGKSIKVIDELKKHAEFGKLFDNKGLLRPELATTLQRNVNMVKYEKEIREIFENMEVSNKMGDTVQSKNLSKQLKDVLSKMKNERTYIYAKLPDNNPNNPLGFKIKKLGFDATEDIPDFMSRSKQAQLDLEVDDMAKSMRELGFKDGGRVDMSIGGLTGSKGGLNLDDRVSKVGTLESMLAGVGAGLIDIPKGAFTLGAALLDMGFGTSNAAKVEKYFDDLTTFDEKAEQTFAGDLTRIMVNLGVPGGFAFKKGADLATKAMLHKRNGNYFRQLLVCPT